MTKNLFSTSSISEDNFATLSIEIVKFHLFGKRILLLAIGICFSLILNAQVSKTVNLTTAGTLSTALTADELNSVTNLTITGKIDGRDFYTMRKGLPMLVDIDLSGATIVAYSSDLANEIPEYAFLNCSRLTALTIPSSVTSIGNVAFSECRGLTTFTIPSSVTTIRTEAFFGCSGLTSVTIPSSVVSIGNIAFAACSGLTSVSIPSSVTSIGDRAFDGCSRLTIITIPASVTSIGDLAFNGCSGLIEVDANNPNYSSLDGVLYNKTQTTLIQCPISKAGNFTILSSVTSIGDFAFQYCIGLTTISIPSSVDSIGDFAFQHCIGLTTVTIPNSVTFIGGWAFGGCSGLTSITIPSSVTSIVGWTFVYCSGLTTVTIPSSVTSIGIEAFYGCSGLTSVTIPSSVTYIGNGAFYGCNGLATVTIPSSVTSIGNSAFSTCSGLNAIIALSPNPVNFTPFASVFGGVNKTTCTLYIPAGSKSSYQAANEWKDFINIVELSSSMVANAGQDQVIKEGTLVTLDGTGSTNINNTALNYKWTAPLGITLNSETASKPTFTAPEVTTDTNFTFSLIVNDGSINSTPDQVVITVKQVNKAPIANAVADQTVNENSLGTLDGSASTDPDQDELSFLWTAPEGINLSSETASNPSFIAPEVSIDTVITFELTVNDGYVNSTADQVNVTVKQVNKAPTANAGTNQSVNENSLVTLDGSASTDPDQDELTYLWTAPAGISLSSETTKNPTFTAPEVSQDNIYRFILVVNDVKTDSDTSQVSIVVKQVLPVLKLVSKTSDSQISSNEVTYQIYIKKGNSFYEESVSPVMNGDTTEFSLEPGEWIVLASPAQNSSAFLPTYSGNTLEWINAEHIIIPEKGITFKEITCFLPEIVNKGAGQISGYVYEKTDTGTKSISMTNNSVASGKPVSGALIRLFKKGNSKPVLSIFTDAQGFYKFEQLEISEYQIEVEIPGFTQSEKFGISISVDQPLAAVSFGVNTTSQVITDTNELLSSSLKIYPNPVVRIVTVEVGRNISSPYSILVYSIDGELMINQVSSTSKTSLDFSELLAGTYLIQVCSGIERHSSIVIKR